MEEPSSVSPPSPSKSKYILDVERVGIRPSSPEPSFDSPIKDGVSSHSPSHTEKTHLAEWLYYLPYHAFKKAYHDALFQLPTKYCSRMAEVFDEANLELDELRTLALELASRNLGAHHHHHHHHQHHLHLSRSRSQHPLPQPAPPPLHSQSLPTPSATPSILTPAMHDFKQTWESCVGGFLKDWETSNLICVLLLSAILTILQIGDANADLLTRYSALSSLMCALISLVFGSSYIIWFGRMAQLRRAAHWAMEVQRDRVGLFWNVWVMMALPAVYLIWSLVLFICCIMAFTWRTGNYTNTSPSSPPRAETVMRGLVSGILGLGCVHGVLIMNKFKGYGDSYGSDREWSRRVREWVEEKGREQSLPAGTVDSYPAGSASAPVGQMF